MSKHTCEFVCEVIWSNQANYVLAVLYSQVSGYIKIEGTSMPVFSLHLLI